MGNNRRVALVTGGAKRVGRAIVERLAMGGMDVAITYCSSGSEADALVNELSGRGGKAVAIQSDFNDPASAAARVFEAFSQHFDRLDVLVNNASTYKPGRLGETDAKLMREMMVVHVETPLLLCRAFEPMLRVARGSVVNMVDLLAERPWPEYLAYCASKAALWNLTLGLARELAPEVTVNGIAPGMVEWPDGFPEDAKEKYLKRVPLGRAGSPDDVAAAVEYLVNGGKYVTGQILRVDGGRSIA